MKSILKTSLLLTGAVLVLDGAAARGADFQETVRVPFPFVVHNKTLPAGRYMLQRDDTDPSLMLIRSESGVLVASYVLTHPAAGRDPSGAQPCLSFTKTGNTYRLSNVWESSDDGVNVIGKK
jgi:hypothetical protein